MNLGSAGKQGRLRDTVIPSDDPNIPEHLRGLPQKMVFPSDHVNRSLADQPKGICVVLEERGLWDHYKRVTREAGKGSLVVLCLACKQSGLKQDAAARAIRLIQEAEAKRLLSDRGSVYARRGPTRPTGCPTLTRLLLVKNP